MCWGRRRDWCCSEDKRRTAQWNENRPRVRADEVEIAAVVDRWRDRLCALLGVERAESQAELGESGFDLAE